MESPLSKETKAISWRKIETGLGSQGLSCGRECKSESLLLVGTSGMRAPVGCGHQWNAGTSPAKGIWVRHQEHLPPWLRWYHCLLFPTTLWSGCKRIYSVISQFSHSVVSNSLWPHGLQHFLTITNSWSLLKLISIESVIPSNHLILCRPLILLPSIFPSIRVFPASQFFTSGGQRIAVSTSVSVLPMNIQDWSPLGWTRWISLHPKGLSRVFPKTTVKKHQFFDAQLSL